MGGLGGRDRRAQQLPRSYSADTRRWRRHRDPRGRAPAARAGAIPGCGHRSVGRSDHVQRRPSRARRLSGGPGARMEGRRRPTDPRAPPGARGRATVPHGRDDPRRAHVGVEARVRSGVRAAARGRGVRGAPAQLSREHGTGPGVYAAERRRSGRGRVRGHRARHRPLHRARHRRPRPDRRHRRELRRLSDRVGRLHDGSIRCGGNGLGHRRQPELSPHLQPCLRRVHLRRGPPRPRIPGAVQAALPDHPRRRREDPHADPSRVRGSVHPAGAGRRAVSGLGAERHADRARRVPARGTRVPGTRARGRRAIDWFERYLEDRG